jgi:type I restriction enzyme S subunit
MEEALDAIIDYRGKTPKKSEKGIPTLSAKSVKNGFLDYSNFYYISKEEYDRFMIRGFPQKGDILLTTEAPLGRVAKLDQDNIAIAQRLLTLRGKAGVLDNDYLMYFLQSKKGQHLLKSHETGTTVTGIKQAVFRKLEISIPDFETQRKVSSILSSIDSKISINKKINKNLEEQAQSILKERFLSHNNIPTGWEWMTLDAVSEMSAGGDKPKNISEYKTEECLYPVYSNGISDEGLYGFTNDYKFSAESVTVSARGTIGFVCLRHVPYTPIVRLVTLVPRQGMVSAKYLYLMLKSIPIHGTGTTQQQLTVPDFRKTEIIVPTEKEMSAFTETVSPLFNQMWANQSENATLSSIRDALLPKLMSGELDVSNIDL